MDIFKITEKLYSIVNISISRLKKAETIIEFQEKLIDKYKNLLGAYMRENNKLREENTILLEDLNDKDDYIDHLQDQIEDYLDQWEKAHGII